MKKNIIIILSIVLIVALTCVCIVGCNKKDSGVINIIVPDGAPALAIANILKDGFAYDECEFNIEIVAGAAEISQKLTAGQADIAVLPTNIAAKLYNNNVGIKLLSANVFGLLYLVGTTNITSIASLRGEKILCTGQGGTPDFVLRYVLESNGINENEVTIEYITQGSDAIAALKAGTAKYALLGEPAATMAVTKANAKSLFDMQAEWKALNNYDGYPQAGLVATDTTITNHPKMLNALLEAIKSNVEELKTIDVSLLNASLKDKGSAVSFASVSVIERCNIKYATAIEAKDSIVRYLEIMKAKNAAFIGGKLPDDAFYYSFA